MTQDIDLRCHKASEEDDGKLNIDRDFVLNSLERAIRNNEAVFTYKVIENPNFLEWRIYTGAHSMLTIMLNAIPVMSHKGSRNTIDFKDLDIYLVSHNTIGDCGLMTDLTKNMSGSRLTVGDCAHLVRSTFAKHNAMAQLPHNLHHILLNLV